MNTRSKHLIAAAIVIGGMLSLSGPAKAGTVAFDWFNLGGNGSASGTLTITSSLINPPNDPTQVYLFDLSAADLAAVGETALGDLTLSFTYGGHTLTQADVSNAPTGWSDLAGQGTLVTPFSASHLVADASGNTLSMVNALQGSHTGFATFGSQGVGGEWLIRPVPLPAAGWLFLTAVSGLMTLVGRRRSREAV